MLEKMDSFHVSNISWGEKEDEEERDREEKKRIREGEGGRER